MSSSNRYSGSLNIQKYNGISIQIEMVVFSIKIFE